VIAVVASRLDSESRSLVGAWSSADAALLSAEDLVSPGWVFNVGDPGSGVAIVDGRQISAPRISAVLTRRPSVLPEELGRIHPADRAYVAAETNAFLVAWLSALPCTVVNRPTTTSLCGPAWDRWHWQCAAARLGLPWSNTDDPCSDAHEVVVSGERCTFAHDAQEAAMAKAISRAAGATLLGVRFHRGKIASVTATPSLTDANVRARLLEHLLGRS
jgi:hypothetical protein